VQAPDHIQPPQDTVPQSLHRLGELAHNLWWSWNQPARQLFESIDPTLWFLTHHNPVQLLSGVKPERFVTLAGDPNFVRQYSAVLRAFDEYLSNKNTWAATEFPALQNSPIAYFSAEFGLHISIPIYSGGLGILAGDHCKEASDLGIPLVGIGFMYPQGYFKQRINPEGWQEATYAPFNRHDSPIHQAMTPTEIPCSIKVEIGHRQVTVLVWQVRNGRMSLYLIDTDVPENTPKIAPSPRGSTVETRKSGSVRSFCSGSAACGSCAPWASIPRSGIAMKAIRPS